MIIFGLRSKSSRLAPAAAACLAAVLSGALSPPAMAQPPNFRGPPLPGAPARPTTSPRPSTPRRPLSPSAAANNSRFEQKQREAAQRLRAEQAARDRQQQWKKQALEKPAPPFDPASAPAPVDCFNAYVAATRNASSMEQLLGYLAQSKQNQLVVEQAEFDPKAEAEERQWFRSKHPEFTEDDLDRRFASPYAKYLRYHKTFVDKIVRIQNVSLKGNTAHITILTHGGKGIDGKQYAYSKAFVEMVGEGNYWKMKDYTSSAVLFD